jgi:hypothetical protein
MFKEPELIKLIKRMIALYLESYPDDRESLERFQRWVLKAWGYEDGQS